LRHAEAEAGDARSDRERSLTPPGESGAKRIGAWLGLRPPPPQAVLCSPALRTRQTLEAIRPALSGRPTLELDDDLYLASGSRLFERVRSQAPQIASVLIVGHVPGVADLAETLVASGDPEASERLRRGYPPAGLCQLEAPIEDWRDLSLRGARLVAFVTPQDLDEGAAPKA
jgi:phosphohistidine phosphatase